MKELTVFIPCFQPDENRKRNLEFIYQRLSEKKIDVVIAVQGAESDYYKKFNYVRFFQGPEQFNKSLILNRCFDFAHESKFFAFMDADIYFSLDAFFQIDEKDEIVKPFSECSYLTEEKTLEFLNNRKTEIPRNSKRISALGGGALIIRSDLIRSKSLKFDENFKGWGWEDIDFGDQIRLKGLKVRTIDQPAVHLYHEPKPTNGLNHDYYNSKTKAKKPIVHVFSSENSDVSCVRSFSENKTKDVILIDCARGDRLNDPNVKFVFLEKDKVNVDSIMKIAEPYVKNNGWLVCTKGSFRAEKDFYSRLSSNKTDDYLVVGNGEGFAKRAKRPMKSIYIQVQNGLANRLRCLSSFAKFAKNEDRSLFVYWGPGSGFSDEKFEDLFEDWPETVKFISEDEYLRAKSTAFKLNEVIFKDEKRPEIYLNKEDPNKLFNTICSEDFCYEGDSCLEYMFPSKLGRFEDDFFSEIKPSEQVLKKVSEISCTFPENTVGVHIRRGDSTLSPWRKYYRTSTIDSFLQLMRKELASDKHVMFYLSTDCSETEKIINEEFPGRVISQNKPFHEVRNYMLAKPFQREALIDMLCLSKTKKMIGSYWSSFSSCAADFGRIPLEIAKQNYTNNVSVIVSCRNRKNALLVSLQSWLRFDEIAEIIIVDWSSDEDMKFLEKIDRRVKVITVPGQKEFNLAKSYNLAARCATKDFILKMDADYVLSPYYSIFEEYDLAPGEFLTGHYGDKKTDKGLGFLSFLNGMILIRNLDFKSVMGYSEDLSNYGYDDCDLYDRLKREGFNRRLLNHNKIHVFHLPHSDDERTSNYQNKNISESLKINVIKSSSRTKKPIVLSCFDPQKTRGNKTSSNMGNLIHEKGVCDLIDGEKVFAPEFDYDTEEINKKGRLLVVPSSSFIGSELNESFIDFIEKIEIPIMFVGLGLSSDTYEPPDKIGDSSKRLLDVIDKRKLPVGVRGKSTKIFLERLGLSGIFEIGCPSNLINKDPYFYNKLSEKLRRKSIKIVLNQNDVFSSNKMKVLVERILFNGLNKESVIVQAGVQENKTNWFKQNLIALFPELNDKDLYESLRRYKTYDEAQEWMDAVSVMDLSVGLRMHGNMAAMQSGCPAIWIYHDIRTKELSEIMALPRISLEEASTCVTIDEIKAKAKIDLEEYAMKRNSLRRKTYEFFDQFGLDQFL